MTNLTREIWGREFNIEVVFEDLDDQGVNEEQWSALGHIIAEWNAIDDSAPALKAYCSKQNNPTSEIGFFENVFRYVIPKYIFVPRDQSCRVVALMCDYRFDPEHGLALVFENEKLKEIGPQDIIL